LEKRYNDDIELEDAIHTAILTLKEGFEGQVLFYLHPFFARRSSLLPAGL
jgi:hypothetical protein